MLDQKVVLEREVWFIVVGHPQERHCMISVDHDSPCFSEAQARKQLERLERQARPDGNLEYGIVRFVVESGR
jgi:hypothetical protein